MDAVLTAEIPGVFENLTVLGNIYGKQKIYRSRMDNMGEGNDSSIINGPFYFLSESGSVRVRNDIADTWEELDFANGDARSEGLQAMPVFFETRYIFRGKCNPDVTDIKIYHRLASVTDGFTYADGWLFGDIDFINTPGRFTLAMDVTFRNGARRRITFRFTVVSVKMNVEKDYKEILKDIENERKGLVQNFLAKTFGDAGFNPKGVSNKPAWYAILESVFDFYVGACRKIVEDPHRRYVNVAENRRADQIRCWTPQMVNRFCAMDKDRQERSYFRVDRIDAKIDTVENRFVLHTLKDIAHSFKDFAAEYSAIKGISNECLDGIKAQAADLERIAGKSFFKGVGRYTGGAMQSLVLQKRPGYAQVLTAWVKLKQSLSPEDRGLDLGYRPLSALYEFWTFLTIRNILKKELNQDDGWSFEENPKISSLEHLLDTDDEFKSDGKTTLCRMGYRFLKEGRTVSLAYQQTYGTTESGETFANVYEQRPDIVLSIRDKGEGEDEDAVYTYLFDAKYRVDELGDKDASPRDAIDDMHRYRDAILYRRQKAGFSREAIGAYVLFPAQSGGATYDYNDMLEKENIGAFPLLPGANGCKEVEKFLKSLLKRVTPEEHLGEGLVFPTRGTSVVVGEAFSESSIPTIDLEPNLWPKLGNEHDKHLVVPLHMDAKIPIKLPTLVRLRSDNKAEIIVKLTQRCAKDTTTCKYAVVWTPSGYLESLN